MTPPLLQEIDIGLACGAQLGGVLGRHLCLQAGNKVGGIHKPGRIKDVQVESVDRRLVLSAQCLAAEQHGERATVGEHGGTFNHLLQADVVTKLAGDRVQTGRAAGGVVRLRQDVQVQWFGHATSLLQNDFPLRSRPAVVRGAER